MDAYEERFIDEEVESDPKLAEPPPDLTPERLLWDIFAGGPDA